VRQGSEQHAKQASDYKQIQEAGAARQYRDARIAPIYEGTNGIQAADLVGGKLGLKGGAVLAELLSEMERDALGEPELLAPIRLCREVAERMREVEIEDRLAASYPFLTMLAVAVSGWLMARQLAAVQDVEDEPAFVAMKKAAVRYYLDFEISAARGLAAATGVSAEIFFESPDEAFSAS
jgi:hypothetical protein